MTAFSAAKDRVLTWLFDQALPLWAERSVDEQGRFYEQLDFEARPVTGRPRRTRVQARQVYVFCEAAALGWAPGRVIAEKGLERLIADYRRDDRLWITATDDAGDVLEATPDLYDLAFVLFALAAAHRVLGDARARPLAIETLSAIDVLMASASGGWQEALPPRLPRRQNPHMHMLEALLAWQATAPDPAFDAAARSVLALAHDRLILDDAVREYFTADWKPDPTTGGIIEPGHLEEWAWLLTQAAGLGLDDGSAAKGLHRQAMRHGRRDGFLIREIGPDGAALNAGRRLWAQTEAIRTGLALGDPDTPGLIARTFEAHLATDIPGLWIDSYEADGRSADRAAPASSFYHLMTAFSELLRSDA